MAQPIQSLAILCDHGCWTWRQSISEPSRRGRTGSWSVRSRKETVAGSSADDIGRQCGGWTIRWQGAGGEITDGTTILEAIRATVSEGTEVTFSADGSGAAGADVAVVVIGEEPYAEMSGDREDLSLDAADAATVKRAAEAGVPVVAAWLPGTEGQGVADVLFGDYSPSGKLSFSWPRSVEQIPVNVGDAEYDPLFAYGFGLSY